MFVNEKTTYLLTYLLALAMRYLLENCDQHQRAKRHCHFMGHEKVRNWADLRGGSPLVSFDHVIDPHFVTFSSSLYTTISNPNPNPNANPNPNTNPNLTIFLSLTLAVTLQ